MVKAIFFDIDGTLISLKTHTMIDSTKKSLKSLREKGIKLFIATGRSKNNIKFLKDAFDFEFDGYITVNGQYCYNNHEVIYEKSIPCDSIKTIIPYLEEKNIACDFVELDYVYINLINDKVRYLYQGLGNEEFKPIEDIHRALEHKIYQLSAFVDVEEEKEFFEYLPGCKSARWFPNFMDVIPIDGGKNTGIDKMLAYYGITLEETMAFGDGGNDMDMLEHVNIGVAMGNADAKVKDVADYVTNDVDDDGIYKALQYWHVLD